MKKYSYHIGVLSAFILASLNVLTRKGGGINVERLGSSEILDLIFMNTKTYETYDISSPYLYLIFMILFLSLLFFQSQQTVNVARQFETMYYHKTNTSTLISQIFRLIFKDLFPLLLLIFFVVIAVIGRLEIIVAINFSLYLLKVAIIVLGLGIIFHFQSYRINNSSVYIFPMLLIVLLFFDLILKTSFITYANNAIYELVYIFLESFILAISISFYANKIKKEGLVK